MMESLTNEVYEAGLKQINEVSWIHLCKPSAQNDEGSLPGYFN